MNISAIENFNAVVRQGGVQRAAAALHRQASTVTRSIQQLEHELGAPLFLRANKRLKLSSQGEIFLGFAEQMLQLANEARSALSFSKPCGLLRVGTHSAAASTGLGEVFSRFHSVYPDVRMEVLTAPSETLVAGVRESRFDAAFVTEFKPDGDLDARLAFREEFVLISPKQLPQVREPGDFKNRSIISIAGDAFYKSRLSAWLGSLGVLPSRVMEFPSYRAVIACVSAGAGIAMVPRSATESVAEQAAIQVSNLPAKYAQADTYLISRMDNASQALSALQYHLGSVGT